MESMVKKYKAGDQEFDLPSRLLELNKKKDYGQYADKAGYMPVNFLTDNDITGGNSGSPVLNGKGELIGIAFDGNIEAMAGDVIFDPTLQRTINVLLNLPVPEQGCVMILRDRAWPAEFHKDPNIGTSGVQKKITVLLPRNRGT